MSTRFIKKRHRKVLPIGHARLRESHILHGKNRQHRLLNYPLYKSCNETYNFNNLKECLENWDEYSKDTKANMNQVVNILNLMDKHEASSQDLREATKVICNEILEYTSDLDKYKPLFEAISSERLKDTKETIINKINEINEYDRVISNYKQLNEDINFLEYFKESLKTNTLRESLYKLCDKLNYGGLATDYCIMNEAILYALDGYPQVPLREITEGIMDYYLEKYNDKIEEFVPTIRECIEADDFIPNEASDYIDYIEYIISNGNILVEETENHFNNNENYALLEDYQEQIKANYYYALNELAIIDKAKEILTKIKTMPNKTITMVEEAINAMFITHRLQDLKKNTFNALSLIFYVTMTAATMFAFPGAAGILLAFLVNISLYHVLNKDYLRDALEEWRIHKHMVEKKIRASHDPQEKTKLSNYLKEVDKNIEVLEKRYEEMRDKTSKELADDTNRKIHSSDFEHSGSLINPIGKYPYDDEKGEE